MTLKGTIKLVDTHCHLNFEEFDPDRKVIVDRAKEFGITKILVPGIDVETSKTAIDCAFEFDEVYAAVGFHPNQGLFWTTSTLSDLRKLALKEKVVAVGEIGLDYYRDRAPKELQLRIFSEQLQLAAELGLPVIIHNREAFEDILKTLDNWCHDLTSTCVELQNHPGVLHSFSGNEEFAAIINSLNFKIGITGPVTFKKSQSLQAVVASQAIRNMVIETDAPFLAPSPFRGMRNEPANVRIVAEKISEIKEISFENVAKITTDEADMLFQWRDSN